TYTGPVTVLLTDIKDGKLIASLVSDSDITVKEGASKEVTVSGTISGLTADTECHAAAYFNLADRLAICSDVITVTLTGAESALTDIATEPDSHNIEYYDLYGRRISDPRPGSVVLRRQGFVTSKIIVK
ncbi:MAG: hypothetical protein K2M97_08255, partial [Muribaculaceae bacterium]|nr:hypothetical protein [Muribaculaceae bacterium]